MADKQEFANLMYAAAQPFELLGLPASYAVAHAAYETGNGTSQLATQCNNYFSQADWKKPAGFTTADGRTFKCFSGPKESFTEYAKLIKTSYPDALKAKTPTAYMQALIKGGYGGYNFEGTPEAEQYLQTYLKIHASYAPLRTTPPHDYITIGSKIFASSILLSFCVFFLFFKK